MKLFRLLKNEIPRESQDWVRHGYIKKEQAMQICEHYGLDYNNTENHLLGLSILSLLAYFFIGLAIILLISHNWDEIPRFVKFAGILIVFVITQYLSLRHYINSYLSTSNYFLLGNFLFGIAIILIAQIFHLGEYMPDGVLAWALGTLPIGVITLNPILTLQSLILATIWLFMELDNYHYPDLFPIFILSGVWVLYKGKNSILLFLSTFFAFGFWFEYSLSWIFSEENRYFDFHPEMLVITIALFIFLYSLSYLLRDLKQHKFKDYAALLSLWTLRFGLVFLFFTIFSEFWMEFYQIKWQHLNLTLSLSIFFIIVSIYFSIQLKKIKTFISLSLIFALPFLLLYQGQKGIFDDYSDLAIMTALIFNFILIGSCIVLIYKGIHEAVSHYFYLGVFSLIAYALIRYFNLFGDFISSAILFIVLAFVLLSVSKYWRRHQQKILMQANTND